MRKQLFLLPVFGALAACSSLKPLDKNGIDVFSEQPLSAVQAAFQRGYAAESADDAGRTALMYAVWKNPDPKVVDFMISKSVDVNAENEAGNTALLIELRKENARLDVVKRLLKAKADVRHRNKSGVSPILTAARRVKDPKIVSLLVKAGADVDDTVDEEPVSGRTPLLVAAENNQNPDVLLALLKEKADKNAVNENGENALMIAVGRNKNLDVAKTLLPLFDLNARDSSCESVLQKALKRIGFRDGPLYADLFDRLKKTAVTTGKKARCDAGASYRNTVNSWSGAPVAALEKTWGKAFRSRTVSDNVKEYFYGYAHQVASETGASLSRKVHGTGFTGGLLTEPAAPQYKNFCQTRFTIENGLVVSGRYAGNACGGE